MLWEISKQVLMVIKLLIARISLVRPVKECFAIFLFNDPDYLDNLISYQDCSVPRFATSQYLDQ